jgi:hypothetical protein
LRGHFWLRFVWGFWSVVFCFGLGWICELREDGFCVWVPGFVCIWAIGFVAKIVQIVDLKGC